MVNSLKKWTTVAGVPILLLFAVEALWKKFNLAESIQSLGEYGLILLGVALFLTFMEMYLSPWRKNKLRKRLSKHFKSYQNKDGNLVCNINDIEVFIDLNTNKNAEVSFYIPKVVFDKFIHLQNHHFKTLPLENPSQIILYQTNSWMLKRAKAKLEEMLS